MNKRPCDEADDETASEDEVTFLLRLRPSPPPRQRRHSLDYKSRPAGRQHCASPTGWDITLQHKEQEPGRNKGKPPQSPTQSRRFSLTEGKDKELRNSPKSPLRKFPNFGMRRKKEETRSSPNWEVIVERQESERKSPTPPPVPPRIQPSAPPQEFPENWYPAKPPFYAPPSPQLYQHQQDNCGSPASPYRYCETDQSGFNSEFLGQNNLTDKSPMRDRLSLSVNNCQVASCLGIGCYNVVLTNSTSFASTSLSSSRMRYDINNSMAIGGTSDLISSYTVLPPLPSPGFHVNSPVIGSVFSPQPVSSMSSTATPLLACPRGSLRFGNFINTSEERTLSKAKSDLSLNLLNHRFYESKSERSSSATEYVVSASDGIDSEESSDDASSDNSNSDSEREHIINEGLETITEEDRVTSSLQSTEGGESSLEDDSTVKEHERWSGSISNRDSTSDLSSSSSDQNRLKDSSTRCKEFQWILKDREKSTSSPKMEEQIPQNKPPINRSTSREKNQLQRKSGEKGAPGSLDRRRHHVQNRHERDQKSRSSHVIKSPPRFDDYLTSNCQSWCCNPHAEPPPPPICYENFHRRHERIDPQRYGSSPMLMDHRFIERGSHSDIYSECGGRYRYETPSVGCCSSYHMAPPCCFFGESRNYHWTPPPFVNKPQEQDERYRKLQGERDNLQLQVQVLSEQIEAQTEKIADLEKSLTEKKQQLLSTEDILQREMLSRSSLETQKLELMSAMSELKLQHAELERELVHLRSSQFNNNSSIDSSKKAQYLPRISPQPHHTSTPVHHLSNQNIRVSPSPSPLSGSLSASPRKIDSSSMQQDTQPPKTPPATYRRQIDLQYSSLPRQQFLSNGGTLGVVDSNANPADGARKGVAFGRGLSSLLGGRARGHSVPNLAETEKIVIEDVNDTSQSPSLQFNKNKGIKKIFGKLKRSGSGNLDDLPGIGEFQRGGVRATAAGRLGCNEQVPKPNKPFEEWDIDDVCNWLQELNLDQYITESKRWGKSGKELHETPFNDIEKELGIKNPLHRKKLQLALVDLQENGSSDPYLSKAGKLDMAWVLRWLDDTGLPQYKESFLINKIDGRVLHRLTMDDLGLLHVTSLLHVASLKRGIQVLRENNYEGGCLQRRSMPDDPAHPTSKQLSLWTTHRVMEWLKAVDLAEYAPNLRGSGVHGGLMVLENKFTAELLASLLSIPPGKTLLRRHLNTHFKELLGKEIIQAKREAEGTLGYIPLTPSSKIKVTKKSHFSLKRNKSKSEADYGDLVCPMNAQSDDDERRSKGRGCLSAR